MDREEDIRLAKNFTLNELIKSSTADRMGLNNWPKDDSVLVNLTNVANHILQPVRDEFGPVIITSGFRSEQLCVKIGSSINSQHSKAEAVDFEVPGTDNADLAYWIMF